jgi:hypothetical protein
MLQTGFLVRATTGQVSGDAVILCTLLTQNAQFLINEGPKLRCSCEAAKWVQKVETCAVLRMLISWQSLIIRTLEKHSLYV